MEKRTLELFLNKYVGIEKKGNNDQIFFVRGTIVYVASDVAIVEVLGHKKTVRLEDILNVREIRSDDDR